MQPFIASRHEQIAELCRNHHVRRLSVFGSALRDDFDPARSDVDLRVEFEELVPVEYAQNYFALHNAFVRLLGRKVDIISAPVIRNPLFRKEIEDTQVTLYAA